MAKINMSEVTTVIEEFIRKESALQESLKNTKATGREIIELSSFTGQTADSIKTYMEETHEKMMESYKTLLNMYVECLRKSKEQFHLRIDPSENSIINQEYIRDWKTEVSESLLSAMSIIGNINAELRKISDISEVAEINIDEISDEYSNMMPRLEQFEEDVRIICKRRIAKTIRVVKLKRNSKSDARPYSSDIRNGSNLI